MSKKNDPDYLNDFIESQRNNWYKGLNIRPAEPPFRPIKANPRGLAILWFALAGAGALILVLYIVYSDFNNFNIVDIITPVFLLLWIVLTALLGMRFFIRYKNSRRKGKKRR